jgi:hypothetical protein
MSDPGTGKFRYNHTNFAQITSIAIDPVSLQGAGANLWFAT